MIWWVILNAFKKMMNKTQFQISLPHPLWFLKTSTPSFLHVWCTLKLQNLLYHFNSQLKPPFMNCVGKNSLKEELVKSRFLFLQNVSLDILGYWQVKWLEKFKILLESAWTQFIYLHFQPILNQTWIPKLFWLQNPICFTGSRVNIQSFPNSKFNSTWLQKFRDFY